MSGSDAMLTCSPSNTTSSYASSEITHRSCFTRDRRQPLEIDARVSTPPVGLFGELRYRMRVFGVIFDSISSRSGRQPFASCSR